MPVSREFKKAMRRAERNERLADLADGRVRRATTFKSRKGKGSYTRTRKHRKENWT